MTGPEHFREAERCLRDARAEDDDDGETTYLIAYALAHATLALAAAVVERAAQTDADWVEPSWAEVAP